MSVDGSQLFEEADAVERAGDPASARALYERVLGALGEDVDLCPAEAMRRIAGCLHQLGDFQAAKDVLEAALASASAQGTLTAEALVLNSLASVEQALGRFDDAEVLYMRARTRAVAGREPTIVTMVDQNLGALAESQGNVGEALQRFAQALGAYEALGVDEHRASLLCRVGQLHTSLESWDAAKDALSDAMHEARRLGDAEAQVEIQVNITRLELARNCFGDAASSIVLSEQLAEQCDDQRWAGEIAMQRGVVHRETGALTQAVKSLRTARGQAEDRGDRLLEADVAREMATTHWKANHSRETLLWLNRSRRILEDLQGRDETERAGIRAEELEALFLKTAEEWAVSVEARDDYQRGRARRVANYAVALANECGIEEGGRAWFEIGALLHDLGKAAVPLSILQKPGPLDAGEWVVMKRHPAEGEAMLAGLEFPWDIVPMVRHHHEAWDGSGYPDNLAGEAIPWQARVLCIADVFDALTTARPYRPAFGLESAIEVMNEMSGVALDPELYRVFKRLLAEERVTLDPSRPTEIAAPVEGGAGRVRQPQ